MSKRFCILLTAILTGLIFLSAGTLVVAATAEPDKVMSIENKGYAKDKKGPFPLITWPIPRPVRNVLTATISTIRMARTYGKRAMRSRNVPRAMTSMRTPRKTV